MTEDDARAWASSRCAPAAYHKLERFHALIAAEAGRQNLIAASTLACLWARHMVDSAQLIDLVPPGIWVDIGSGAGFPGMVVATMRPDQPVVLVEPRPGRAEFLRRVAEQLDLTNTTVEQKNVRSVHVAASVISARAVASVTEVLDMSAHLASSSTIWVLPKGRNAEVEISLAKTRWKGVFHVKQSITDLSSAIVLASQVSRR